MTFFLTSSPTLGHGIEVNPRNGFKERLQKALSTVHHGVFIASDPKDHEGMEGYARAMKQMAESLGADFQSYVVLDDRTAGKAGRILKEADFVLLAGGHVPTQNAFFQSFPLKMLLSRFKGVVLGVSAGTMNSAEVVYAQPEEEGEGIDPNYKKFLKGLGLTKVQVLPHYQEVKDAVLDGKRVFEDITYPDSMGHTFFVFPDGTYLYKDEKGERIYGECWTIHDGKLTKIGEEGDELWIGKD